MSKIFNKATLTASLLCVLLGSVANAQSARSIYVSPAGSDRNPGSIDQPVKTINAAAAMAGPGTTVFVRSGIYRELVRIEKSGTNKAQVRLQPYPGEKVVIDGAGGPAEKPLVMITGSYVQFLGFDVRNSRDIGVLLEATHHVTVAYNVIHDSYLAGVEVEGNQGKFPSGSSDNLIKSNIIYHNCLTNSARIPDAGWPAALQTADSERIAFVGNRVYQNYGEGVSALRAKGTQIVGNTAYDNYSMNIYLDNAPSTLVDGNFSYSTGDARFLYKKDQRAIGIGIANEKYWSPALPAEKLVIRNNITVGTRYGFYYGNYDVGGGMQNSLIANNTFVNATDAGIYIDSGNHRGTELRNSVIYSARAQQLADGEPSGVTLSHNCWYGGRVPGNFMGFGDRTADPKLAQPGSLDANGYLMSAASACAKVAPRLAAVPYAFNGQPRANPTNMGVAGP